jgi:hypothetical protein
MQLGFLTSLIDFLNMAIALWIAVYIFARGRNNRITFRAVILLLAVAFYFFNSFTFEINPASRLMRTGALLIAVVAAHNLTYYLLPENLQAKLIWMPRIVFGMGLVAAFVLAALPDFPPTSYLYINPPILASWSVVVDAYFLLASLAIVYNLFLIARAGYRPLNFSFYLALFFGLSVIGYALVGAILRIPLLRLVGSLLLLTALILLGYSIARHQVLIERRTIPYDFVITALAIGVVTVLFMLVGIQMELSGFQLVLIAILVITSFSIYDLVRDSIVRLYAQREQEEHRLVQQIARNSIGQNLLQQNLEAILEILCQSVQASSGFIGILSGDEYLVKATRDSLPIDDALPKKEVELEDLTRPKGLLRLHAAWLAPAYCGGEQIAVIGISGRTGLKDFTRDDLFWLEDVADHTAKLIFANGRQSGEMDLALEETLLDDDDLEKLVKKPDPDSIKLVEEGLKNLNDYIVLGKSPLADQLAVDGETHIERGKAVHDLLVETIKSLRPEGERPAEPLPREWHNYVIINDAYIEDIRDREIMAKLYISEGTYYRTRRRALRGVTRALMEGDFLDCQEKV